jgi:predicted transcriptional regulator
MTIDFACKRFEIEDVIKCSLALTKSDFILIKFLMKKESGAFTTEELSEKLSFEKSTVQRSVKKLHEKGLLFRSQVNQSQGGYIFYYKIKDRDKIREMILAIVNSWHERFKDELRKW